MEKKTGRVSHIKYIIENDPIKGILTVHDMQDVELIDERGNLWETESPVKEKILYTPKSEEYFDTLKELKQKYNVSYC